MYFVLATLGKPDCWLVGVNMQALKQADARRGGLGVETPIFPDFLPRATTFLVMTAFNSVLPELVVLISTTSSGRTELNAVITKKVVARGRKSGFRPPAPHVSLMLAAQNAALTPPSISPPPPLSRLPASLLQPPLPRAPHMMTCARVREVVVLEQEAAPL